MATSTTPQTSGGPNGQPAPGSNNGATPAEPKNNKRRTRVLLGLVIVAVVVGVAWGAHWWLVGRFIESTDDAYLRADSVTISPKVSGYVLQLYVGDNVSVKAGQPLLKLDTRQYQASLDQAKATIDARQADIVRAQADITQQEASIEQAKAQAEASRINYDHAAREYDRYAPLAATGAETSERVSDLRNTRDQAQATYRANLAAVKAADAQIASIKAQIVQAKAQMEASQASMRDSAVNVEDTVVRSPIAGRIGDRTVRVGQYLQPGTKTMTVVPTEQVYLVANYKETQLGAMRVGQPASLHVDAMPGVDLHGVVDSFAPGTGSEFALLPPENATGNFTKIVQRVPVRIRIDADAQTRSLLLPGMSVTVDIDTSVTPQAQPAQPTTAASDTTATDATAASANASTMSPTAASGSTASAASGTSASAPSGVTSGPTSASSSAANHG
ncbi:HlyD family secretion protein [Robbsia sp. KACC 23696]|uniref:HlyD family secretion protein n=1 Tax=Robbsia sp. KACC 23696 TaxID=3149231 RepID=UPI00325C0EAD